MDTSIIKMSNAYENIDFSSLTEQATVVDLRLVEGTKCYLDDLAKEQVVDALEDISIEGIHFIDSGNYHYLSLLMISRIGIDFELVLVDNHPDMKAPAFGGITSCGGWVLEALETLPHLKRVYMFGVKDELIKELEPLPEKVVVNGSIPNSALPIYVSVDKDALSREYAVTDWDQGEMSLDELVNIIKSVNRNIIGIDICGDTSEPVESSDQTNMMTNKAIFDIICGIK